jgi:hypothetical protein
LTREAKINPTHPKIRNTEERRERTYPNNKNKLAKIG